ncbi:OTU-domain-containing protein [Naematelia encephala]|uniref:Ubiquitin thioesterase OTU n=1 Tax=Naematelia encephala TaxID=71784 RepID=A0A1Y2B6U2_9TREE|nr:OTU-domain-containing protein [Naematelia encephala]
MVAIRLRHPRGVTTIEINPETDTIDDLKVLIFSSTEIAVNEQEIKYGYPPKPLPETTGTLSTIPITRGEQVIVTSVPASAAQATSLPHDSAPTPAPSVKPLNEALSAPTEKTPRPSQSQAQPPTPTPAQPSSSAEESSDSVALPGRDAGFLQLRVVPDDNSCLFSAIGVVFEGGIEANKALRKVVADAIKADALNYSDVILGQPREQYITKILKPDTWGGAIELSIFSKHYQTEISSFDVATGRCDRFGQDEYSNRCVLVYSGIHYDAATLAPTPDAPPAFHTTIFPTSDSSILPAAQKLVAQLKARHYYTDTSNFDLRCGVCGVGLKGQKGATEHAKQTGHVEFGEY